MNPITFRPAEDVRVALVDEIERRPGVTLTFLINEAIRAGLRVPTNRRPKLAIRKPRTVFANPEPAAA